MPLICLSTRNRRFYIRNSSDDGADRVGRTDSRINLSGETLTYKDYKNGNWTLKNSSWTAEELYDEITPNLSDLVYRISIQKTIVSIGYCSLQGKD